MIGKLFNYISSLVFPFLGPIFTLIQNDPAASGLSPSNVAYSNCEIMNSANSQNSKENQEFFKSLANALLKELLRLMLVFAIREFKKLVANYFTRIAIEKQKRKSEKIKNKFNIFSKADNINSSSEKAKKYAAATTSLSSILGDVES